MREIEAHKDDIPRIVHEKLLLANAAVPEVRIYGGLSSALVFRCISPQGRLCLRAWPRNGPTRERLQQIRAQVDQTHRQSLNILPQYLMDTQGSTYVHHDARFWELTQWMPGKPDYLECPSQEKLAAALRALAALHRVWAGSSRLARSPAVASRIRLLAEAQLVLPHQSDLPDWSPEKISETAAQLAERTRRAVQFWGPTLMDQLRAVEAIPVATHFVLRDIWSDHVLFTDDKVSGIIDLGAAREDEPATDLARLLGSLEPYSRARWMAGLEAYRELQPQIEPDRVEILDRASCLLSAVQWMNWLWIERKEFAVESSVLYGRWRGFLERLDSWQ